MNLAYLTDIIIMLVAAVVAVPLSRIIGLGTVPGFFIAGIVVGPSALSLIDNSVEIGHLAELGVVLLLFVIGIELKPSRLWLMRHMVFGLGTLQVTVTGAIISAAAIFVFGLEPRAAILIGPALALSSTSFVLQLLTEQRMLTSRYGRSSVAVLLFQDLAVVPLLALVSLLTVTDLTIEEDIGLALIEAMVILALIILGGRYLLQPLLQRVAHYGTPEVFTACAVLLVLGSAVIMAQIGLSMAMGAFVAGLLVADSEFRHQVVAEIQPFRGLLLGLFFMSMGMSLQLLPFFENSLFFIGIVVLLMSTKIALLWAFAALFGHKGPTAPAIGLLLAQSGEFALVLFAVAFDATLINEELFQQLLIIVILSMFATPPLAGIAHRLITKPGSEIIEEELTESFEKPASILVIGFGRVGHRVGQILEKRGLAYIAVEHEAEVVRLERNEGRSVVYGDALQPGVLHSLGIADMELVIVTVDDFQAAERLVSSLHHDFPDLNILVRAHDKEHCHTLQAQGARLAVSENLEASIALAKAAMAVLGGDKMEDDAVIDQFRKDYHSSTKINFDDG